MSGNVFLSIFSSVAEWEFKPTKGTDLSNVQNENKMIYIILAPEPVHVQLLYIEVGSSHQYFLLVRVPGTSPGLTSLTLV